MIAEAHISGRLKWVWEANWSVRIILKRMSVK